MSQNIQASQQLSLIGQILDGKYRIEAKLGSGGMGDVYRATRLLIGDTVAIKFLHAHLASNPQAAQRFRHEAVTATRLRHRNIVAIYDVGISAFLNVPYILMEIAEGFTLRQIIKRSKILPLDFAVTVTAQVCAALDEAHRLGIVHRDIKPENIIANQTPTGWHVKVLDFGIAKLYNEANAGLTQEGNALGTPQYMSPEQCMGEQVDGRSDIYSLAIVIYEMLCGNTPFNNAPASAIAVHQVKTEPPPPRSVNPNISPEIEAVILRALSKKRELRPQTAHLFSQEFIQAATIAFKSETLIGVPPMESNQPEKMKNSAIFTKPKPIQETENADTDKENLQAAIPKPEGEIAPFEEAENHSTDADLLEKEDDSKIELKEIFEDAEFILDEILPEKKDEEKDIFLNSQPIIKPSEPLVLDEEKLSEKESN